MLYNYVKFILGFILFTGATSAYAQSTAPIISNDFPSSAYVGQSYSHTPIVDAADANFVGVSNYQAPGNSGPVPGDQYRVNSHSSSHQHEAAFVQLNDGAYVIAWQSLGQDGSDYGVYAQMYTQDGQPIGVEFPLHSVEQGDQKSVALAPHSDGGFVAVWESENLDDSGRAIAVRQFNLDGTPVGAEIAVNATISGDQITPDIILLSNDSYIVTWVSESDDSTAKNIVARVLQSDTTPVDGEWSVNTYRTENQDRPRIAAMSNDNVVILWQSYSQDGSGYGVYHRRFLADGTPLDASDVLVNVAQQYVSQWLAELTVLTNDNYVITYSSTYQGADQSGDGVFQSLYSPSGTAIVSDVLVNTYTPNSQESSTVSALAGGGYINAWNSYPQDGSGYGVYFQQYDNSATAVGDETLAAELTEGDQRYPLIGALSDGGFVVVFRSEWTAWDEYWGVHARNFSILDTPPGDTQFTDLFWSPTQQPDNSEQTFSYRKIDGSNWIIADAALVDGVYRVSFEGLDEGMYQYKIDYTENDLLAKRISNNFSVGGESTTYPDALYFELTLAPSGMTMDSATGVVAWTPGQSQVGNHDVSFTVWNSSELNDTQTATITVSDLANTPPVITSDAVLQATVGEQYAYAVIAIDEQTQNLAYRLSEAPVEMSIDLSTGFISWRPTPDDIGLHAVSVIVTDEGGLSAQQDYQILVDQINTAPTITSDPVIESNRGDLYIYDVDAVDPDLLDTMTFILLEAPEGMTINASTGEINWDTSNTAVDTYPVSVLVFDSLEASDQQNFLISLRDSNLPPVIISEPMTQTAEGQSYQYDVNANDPNTSDALTYHINNAHSGMSIDAISGLVEWTSGSEYYVGVAQSAESCRMPIPDIGTFEPVLKWEWNSSSVESNFTQVMAPPVVAQLSDDNDDGLINSDDTPDVIFASFVNDVRSEAMLRVISGADGSEVLTINNPAHRVGQFSMPAVGDIDGDGRPEIVALGFENKMFVFEDDGSLKWELQDDRLSLWSPNNYGGPSLADIDQNGTPEIIFGTAVISAEGEILWKGAGTHSGRNHWDGNVADYFTYALDWDESIPGLEIIAGASVYDKDGNLLWQNDIVGDGFTAVANFDADADPELVVVNDGRVYIVDNDGQMLFSSVSLPGGGVGGPPTVADMNGDGIPEIGVAGQGAYSVLDNEASLLWWSETQDNSSHFTGSTVFDFDGDGRAEVVYGDEIYLYVYRGETGEVLFQIPNGSGTALEYPVVADIDSDGHAELLVVRNYFQSSIPGIRAFEDANDSWVATRQQWNQYSYHIDHINDDGTVPTDPEKSWQTHNSFRLNAFGDRSPLSQPDLIISDITVIADQSGSGLVTEFDAHITVENSGDAAANGQITISLYSDDPSVGGNLLGEAQSLDILAGGSVETVIRNISTALVDDTLYAVISTVGVDECVTKNNSARAAFVHVDVADPDNETDHQVYALNVIRDISAPVITSTATTDPAAGDLFTYDLNAEGLGELTYELQTAPEGMTIDSVTGVITWLPSITSEGERFNVEVRVEGEQGLFDIQNFTLEVQTARLNTDPVIVKEVACEFDQYDWLEVSGSFVVSNEGRTFNESTDQSGNAIGNLDLGLNNQAYWEIQVDAIDLLQSLGWGVIRDTDTVLQPPYNLTWDHRNSVVARTTYSWVADYGQGGAPLYSGTSEEAAFQIGDTLMVAWDKGRLYFGSNGVWWNNADPANGIGFIAEGLSGFRPYLSHNNIGGSSQYTVNSTNADFTYQSPFLCPAAVLFSEVGDDYAFDAEAFDADGDVLVYSLTESPSGMTIDTASGLVEWMPAVWDVGDNAVNVRVQDGRGGEDNYSFTLTVDAYTNGAPVIVSYPKTIVREPEYFYFVQVEDPNFGDIHTFYLDAAPQGMTIDTNTGVILWAPTLEQVGDHDVSVRVQDSGGLEGTQLYTLSYVTDPTAPVIVSDPIVIAEEAVLYQYDVDAIDPNPSEILTYSLNQSPASMEINSDTGLINWYAYSPEGFTEIPFDALEEAAHINDQYPGIHFSAYDTDGTPKPIYAEFHDDPRYGASEQMYLAPRVYRTDNIYDWEINFDSPVDYFYIRVLDAEEALTIETYRGNVKVGSFPQPRSGNEGHDFSVGEIGGDLLFDRIVFNVDPGGPELFDNVKYHTAALATVEVRATNSLGKFDEQRFDIAFTTGNFPPVFTSRPIRGGVANSEYRYQLTAVDYSSDPVAYALENAPDGMQVDGNGLITWSPILSDLGQHPIRLIATDGQGGEDTQEYLLTVRDTDSSAIFTSQPLLLAYPNIEYAYKARAYDPEGDEVHFYLQQGPEGMSVNLADGQLVWTPSEADIGYHNISIEGRGRFGGQSATQDFVLQVIGESQAPHIISSPVLDVYVDSEYRYTVNAIDLDETSFLNYQLLAAPAAMTIDTLTGEMLWTPTTSELGDHAIQVQVMDSDGLSDSQTFTLTVLQGNAFPVISSTPSNYATVDSTYVYDIVASDENTNDVLTYSLLSGPVGMDVNGATGTLSWTPGNDDVGSHDVSVRVTDPAGAYVQQNFTVTVQNADIEPPVVGLVVNPIDVVVGDTVDIQISAFDNVAITSVTLEINGQSITLDGENSAVYTPSVSGTHTVVATAVDTSGNSTSTTLDINVSVNTNTAPVITSNHMLSATSGIEYVYDVQATDAEGDTLTYSLVSAPSGMTIDSTMGEIIWIPNTSGAFAITVRVSDGELYDEESWQIVVAAPIPLFAELSVTPNLVDPGESVTIGLYVEGAIGNLAREVWVDGAIISLDEDGTALFSSDVVGEHVVDTVVSDSVDSVTDQTTFFVRDLSDTTPPVVTLSSPNIGEMTTITDVIGSVNDENLISWQLGLVRKDSGHMKILADGSENFTSSSIASIEPFALMNGLYSVVLQASDIGGNTVSESRQIVVEGNLKVGNFSISFTDVVIPTTGIDISVTRTYDTRRREEDLDFGYGWTVDYQDAQIFESRKIGSAWELVQYATGPFGIIQNYCVEPIGDAPVVAVLLPNGRLEKFEVAASPQCNEGVPILDVNFVFTPMEGTYATLNQASYGSVRLVNGNLEHLGDSEVADADIYQMSTVDGTTYNLDQNFGIRSIIDTNGNHVTFSDTGIVSSTGKSIEFQRDAEGRITRVTDPMGHSVSYGYDTGGDLVSVVDQVGDQTQFAYLADHYLHTITSPSGVVIAANEYDSSGRFVRQTDSSGDTVEFIHDLINRREIIVDQLGRSWTYLYDVDGNILEEVDPDGNTITRTYDTDGNELTVTDQNGNTATMTYDTRGNLLSTTDPNGNTISASYDSDGRILTETTAGGGITQYSYDGNGNVLSISGPLGTGVTHAYDAQGNLLSTTDALGNVTLQSYDAYGNVASTEDAEGNVRTYSYDLNGNLAGELFSYVDETGNVVSSSTTKQYDGKNRLVSTVLPDGRSVSRAYTSDGALNQLVNASGHTVSAVFDARGNASSYTFADGTTIQENHDAFGLKRSQTDVFGRTTQYNYNNRGERVETIHPDGSITMTSYDPSGQINGERDANGNWTQYEYDLAGNRTKIINALGEETLFTYDADGNHISMTDANGHTTSYQYDLVGRLTRTNFPDSTYTETEYDISGRVIAEIDQKGNRTEFDYDALGRLIKVTDPLLNETIYTYNALGKRNSETDARGNTTSWVYDANGRIVERTLPIGMSESHSYDSDGYRVGHTDFNGGTTSMSYDVLSNRLSSKSFPDGTQVQYAFDEMANTWSSITTNGETETTYVDAMDRVTRVVDTQGNEINYTYDAAGNRASMTSESGTIQYEYDALNRLTKVIDIDLSETDYTYDAVGNVKTVSYPNNVVSTYFYDTRNQLVQVEHREGVITLLGQYSYVLDDVGNRTQVSDHRGRIEDFEYDALNRLTRATINEPTQGLALYEYTYDEVSNLATVSLNGLLQESYSYDENDRIQSGSGITYAYDLNGNTLSATGANETASYSYDSRNRLVDAQLGGNQLAYQYDDSGIRTHRTVNGVTSRYLVDKQLPYAQVVEERDGGNGLTARYTHGLDLVSQERSGNKHYFHTDALGSTRLLTDSSGSVSDEYSYLPYGKQDVYSGSTNNDYQYTGEQYDPELGKYYLRARYYSPTNARFLNMDTWAGRKNDPTTLNKYLYANANPVMNVDPSGNFSLGSLMAGVNVRATLTTMAQQGFRVSLKCAKVVAKMAGGMPAAGKLKTAFRNLIKGTGICGATGWQTAYYVAHRTGLSVTQKMAKNYVSWKKYKSMYSFIHRNLWSGKKKNPGYEYHHIVEQSSIFSGNGNAINSVLNVVPTLKIFHAVISKYYSSKPVFTEEGGGNYSSFRKWLNAKRKSYPKQSRIGLNIWVDAHSLDVNWTPNSEI
ncbi:MAG: putative Ig domain-containing protein [Agarilytica sp.]